MDKLAELLGYGPSFIYAAAAYGLFSWLDENASDEAKAALAKTTKLGALGTQPCALGNVCVARLRQATA